MRSGLVASIMMFARLASAEPQPPERAVVAAIDLGPAVPDYLAAKAITQIEQGLEAAGYQVVPGAKDPRLTGELATCREGACVRQVGAAMAVQAVVYATISRDGDNTVITMRLFDAKAALQDADVREVCELCGEAELSERLGVAASALRARAVEARERRAKLTVKHEPTPPIRIVHETRTRSMVPGIAIGAAGAVVLAGGIFLIAIDGNGRCSPGDGPEYPAPGAVIRFPDPADRTHYVCRDVYQTKLLGIAGTGLGAAAIVTGALLIIRARRHDRTVEITPLPGGAAVKVSLPW